MTGFGHFPPGNALNFFSVIFEKRDVPIKSHGIGRHDIIRYGYFNLKGKAVLIMGNVSELIGAALVGVACTLGLVAFMSRKRGHDEEIEQNKGGMVVLAGELVDMAYDKEKGLTRVDVRDSKGVTQTGFSTLSVGQLASLYAGKGWVQIPTCRL